MNLRIQTYGRRTDGGSLSTVLAALTRRARAAGDDALGVLGITVFAAFSGVRLKEVRLAKNGDFSAERWELVVHHPKGEGAYASARKARVALPGRPAVQDFLDLRAKALERAGVVDGREVPLVPFIRERGGVSPWNDAYLHKVKVGVLERAGIRFDFRSLRRSFGQCALDKGARYDTVSVLLGHKTTRTTETYCTRRKYDHAAEELERVWV